MPPPRRRSRRRHLVGLQFCEHGDQGLAVEFSVYAATLILHTTKIVLIACGSI